MNKEIRILIVDDHAVLRSGLRSLLQLEEDLSVVGEASNGREAIGVIKQLLPDVVVMDIRMPDLNGVEATRQAIAIKPDIKIIGLSANSDERSPVEMLRAGAVGYVMKEATFEELAVAIRTVVRNKVYFSPTVISHMADNKNGAGGVPVSPFNVLSARERETLQLISEGKATKEVAALLGVSIKTIETHRRNLMEKLRLDSVAELTKYAIREGLTSV